MWANRPDPTEREYFAAVREAAKDGPKVPLHRIFASTRKRDIAEIRWRAWRSLKQRKFSLISIARVSGFDHSTVFYGLRELEKMEMSNVAE